MESALFLPFISQADLGTTWDRQYYRYFRAVFKKDKGMSLH